VYWCIFEVEFPKDGSNTPPKHPNLIRKIILMEHVIKDKTYFEESNSFIRASSRNTCPIGQGYSKRVDAINFIMGKVPEKEFNPHYINLHRNHVEQH
jgi:hypothetical protein